MTSPKKPATKRKLKTPPEFAAGTLHLAIDVPNDKCSAVIGHGTTGAQLVDIYVTLLDVAHETRRRLVEITSEEVVSKVEKAFMKEFVDGQSGEPEAEPEIKIIYPGNDTCH